MKSFMRGLWLVLVFLIFVLAATPISAQTSSNFVVNSAGNQRDITPGDGLCVTSVNTCTLRAAIQEANAHLNGSMRDSITFNLPAAAGTLISIPQLPAITEPVFIDATTQPGLGRVSVVYKGTSPVINDGLTILAGDSEVRGLAIFGFRYDLVLRTGGNNRIINNILGPTSKTTSVNINALRIEDSANNQIGGTTEGTGNTMQGSTFGLYITGNGSFNNRVEGNLIGNTDGLPGGNNTGVYLGDGAHDNQIGSATNTNRDVECTGGCNDISYSGIAQLEIVNAPNNRIQANTFYSFGTSAGILLKSTTLFGGPDPEEGNWVMGGVAIFDGGTVQGNRFGSTRDGNGTTSINAYVTVYPSLSNTPTLIGGTSPGMGNLFTSGGINLDDHVRDVIIQGNIIGQTLNGSVGFNSGNKTGVIVRGTENILIGGTEPGAGNIITDGTWGVYIHNHPNQIKVLGNSVFNNRHNYTIYGLPRAPVITGTDQLNDEQIVRGYYQGQPDTPYRIELFSNQLCNADLRGEGETLIGVLQLVSDSTGRVEFDTSLALTVDSSFVITATATSDIPTGFTSGYSNCAPAYEPDVSVDVIAPTAISSNTQITVEYTVTNNGNLPVYGLKVGPLYPATNSPLTQLAYVSHEGPGSVTDRYWNLEDLNPGEAKHLTLVLAVPSRITDVIYDEVYLGRGIRFQRPVTTSIANSVVVEVGVNMALSYDQAGPEVFTAPNHYEQPVTITASKNPGDTTVRPVKVQLTLPSNVVIVSFEPSEGTFDALTRTWSFQPDTPQTVETLNLTLGVNAVYAGSLMTSSATLTMPGDYWPENNQARIEWQVGPDVTPEPTEEPTEEPTPEVTVEPTEDPVPTDPAQESPFLVNTTADENDGICGVTHCSLREAVIAANQDSANTVPQVYLQEGTYVLSLLGANENGAQTGDLDILRSIQLVPWPNWFSNDHYVIDGNGTDRIFDIHNAGTFDIQNVTLRNGASELGGAVHLHPAAALEGNYLEVIDNHAEAGGAFYLEGRARLTATDMLTNHSPESAALVVTESGRLSLNQSAIARNMGSGVQTSGSLFLSEVTISENSSYGILDIRSLNEPLHPRYNSVFHSTIAHNTLGGIVVNNDDQTIIMAASILSDNGPGGAQDCGYLDQRASQVAIESAYNVVEDDIHCELTDWTGSGGPYPSKIGVDALLEALADNGGYILSLTHALGEGSPALGYVATNYCVGNGMSSTDQLGYSRPAINCDAGAYESYLPNPPDPTEEPTPEVTPELTEEPTPEITPEPTEEPTEEPTPIGSQNLILNGDFSAGLANWQTGGAVVSRFTDGAFEFYFNPTLGTQKPTLSQTLNESVTSNQTLELQLNLANSAPVRKLVRVALSAPGQADSLVCTFWLDAGAPWATYTLRGRPQIVWSQTQVQLTLQTADNRRWVGVDNLQLYRDDAAVSGVNEPITCTDPTAPLPSTGTDSANLIRNGGFSQDLNRWTFTGDGVSRFRNGMFEFYYPTSGRQQPTLQQTTTTSVPDNTPFEVRLWLGNRSSMRKPVVVTLRARNNSDSQQCTFWLPPNAPLGEYVMRTFTTTAFTDLTLTLQTNQRDGQGWIRVDNVAVQHRPALTVNGTTCYPVNAGVPVLGSAPAEVIDPVLTGVPPLATVEPTTVPTDAVTVVPTDIPLTVEPTLEPTTLPTEVPTLEPTLEPTPVPTEPPTPEPTATPEPTSIPEPTQAPTEIPVEVTSEG